MPLKNLIIIVKSKSSEQLKTKHYNPKNLLISFIVSVFPVPAGPNEHPP